MRLKMGIPLLLKKAIIMYGARQLIQTIILEETIIFLLARISPSKVKAKLTSIVCRKNISMLLTNL